MSSTQIHASSSSHHASPTKSHSSTSLYSPTLVQPSVRQSSEGSTMQTAKTTARSLGSVTTTNTVIASATNIVSSSVEFQAKCTQTGKYVYTVTGFLRLLISCITDMLNAGLQVSLTHFCLLYPRSDKSHSCL